MKYQEWKDILQKGIDGKLSDGDLVVMNSQSCDWNCCAVGAKIMCDMKVDEISTANGKIHANTLLNSDAWKLGNFDFPTAISGGNYETALAVLEEIYAMENIYISDEQRDEFIELELNANLPII